MEINMRSTSQEFCISFSVSRIALETLKKDPPSYLHVHTLLGNQPRHAVDIRFPDKCIM